MRNTQVVGLETVPIRALLKGGTVYEGVASIPRAQSITGFLSSRKGGVLSLGSVTASAVDFVAPSSAGIGEFNVQCAAVNLSAVTAIHDLGEIGTPVPIGNPLEQSIKRRTSRISLISHAVAE